MGRTNLKVFRVKNHMTQTEMVGKIGMHGKKYSRQCYAAIEAGRRNGRQDFWNDLQAAFKLSDAETWSLMKTDKN